MKKKENRCWNNVGFAVYDPIEELSYELSKQQFDVSLFGLAEKIKVVQPAIRSQKTEDEICNRKNGKTDITAQENVER